MDMRIWFATFLRSNEDLDNLDTLRLLWGDRSQRATRRLLSVGELRALLPKFVGRVEHARNYGYILDAEVERRELGDADEVGDTNDVHFIIPPRHAIGCVAEECEDGYRLVTLEAEHSSVTAFCHLDKVLSVVWTSILRQESYGNSQIL